MTTHIRTQIRAAAKLALTGLAATGSNVFATRTIPVEPTDLPALCIYTMQEDSGLDGTARGLRRVINLIVEAVFASPSDDFDAVADISAYEVEVALAVDRTLGGLAYDVELVSTRLAMNGEGKQSTGHCVMTFAVTTRTQVGAPGVFA
jgi:hypothetical protein